MPAGKSSQSNASLYTAITFVALFLIAATAAIILYMKYEDQKVIAANAKSARDEVVTEKEYRNIGNTIGKPTDGKSYTATLLGYFTMLDQFITGQISESNAAAKIEVIKKRINEVNDNLGDDASGIFGKDGVDLLFTISDLKNKLDLQRQAVHELNTAIEKIGGNYKIVVAKSNDKETALINEVNHWQKKADEIQVEYNDIKQLMEQSTEEQVQTFKDRLAKTKQSLGETIKQLETTKKELADTTEELKLALEEREKTLPKPDREVAAFNPDAKVTTVDLEMDLIYLDIGSDDHVYSGLTFTIFDKNNPRPKDGKGKAEIEVFRVGNQVSAARIITSNTRNPIKEDDLAVNLIWNSETSNKFVVIGDFDFNGDEMIDKDGTEKIQQLIERWGGKVTSSVSIGTDFIVFGSAPKLFNKPTLDQIERDPTLESRYNEAIERNRKYQEVFKQAEKLDVPTFNRSRFFNLIGYETTSKKISPF
jgi:hypothetical protein